MAPQQGCRSPGASNQKGSRTKGTGLLYCSWRDSWNLSYMRLIVPFLRLGEVIMGGQHIPLTSDAFKKVIIGHASKNVLLSIVHAMLGWLIAGPFVLAALYTISIPCFKLLIDKFGSIPSCPETLIKAV